MCIFSGGLRSGSPFKMLLMVQNFEDKPIERMYKTRGTSILINYQLLPGLPPPDFLNRSWYGKKYPMISMSFVYLYLSLIGFFSPPDETSTFPSSTPSRRSLSKETSPNPSNGPEDLCLKPQEKDRACAGLKEQVSLLFSYVWRYLWNVGAKFLKHGKLEDGLAPRRV